MAAVGAARQGGDADGSRHPNRVDGEEQTSIRSMIGMRSPGKDQDRDEDDGCLSPISPGSL
jgi:hypothetical protein